MSSLQQQLQSIASLDASRLTSRTGQPSSKSYLFPANEAASHDLDAIFALGSSGFEELVSLDPDFAQYEDELFSEKSKRTDRMLLSPTENADLDKVLARCLRRLGRWVGIMAGGRCLEWLVRRFRRVINQSAHDQTDDRVHEMNAEVLLQVFLPYHSSPNFARVLAIISLPKESAYTVPFAPLVKNAQPVPRSYITTVIAPEREKSLRLLEDVAGMLSVAIAEGAVHRAMVAFWSGVIVELLDKSAKGKGAGEGLVKVLVETFVTVLSTRNGGKDVNAAVYPPLILLTRSTYLADEPFSAILTALLTDDSGADASQRILTLLVILNDRTGWDQGLDSEAVEALARVPGLESLLLAAMERYDFTQALSVLLSEMVKEITIHLPTLQSLVKSTHITPDLIHLLASRSLVRGSATAASGAAKAAIKTFLGGLRERYPAIVDAVALETTDVDYDLIARPDSELAMLSVLSADVTARAIGVEAVMAPHLGKSVPAENVDALKLALESRLGDQEVQVLEALYRTNQHRNLIWEVVGVETVMSAIRPAFISDKLDDPVTKRHLNFVSAVSNDKDAQQIFEQLLFPVVMPTNGRALSAEAWAMLRKSNLAKHNPVVKALAEGNVASVEAIAKSICEALQSMSKSDALQAFIVSQLAADIPASRLLAHVVVAQLLADKSSDVRLANQVLQQLRALLDGGPIGEFDDCDTAVSAKLLSMIASKPKASRTTQRATLALFSAMIKVIRPAQSTIWLSDDVSSFKRYASQVYLWANSDILPAQLARGLLQSLFLQLGSETLLFLASIWTDLGNSAGLRLAALKHASSFVTAHKGHNGVDFQLVLPSILIALSDSQRKVRVGGVALLRGIISLSGSGDEVYALDTIYGAKSDLVKLLKQADIAAYLGWLSAASEQFTVDGKQVHVLHSEKLSQSQGETKKDVAQRRAVIGAVLSHVVACQSISTRLAILRILAGSRDIASFRGALPLLLSAQTEEQEWVAGLTDDQREEYVELLFSGMDSASVNVLLEEEYKGWTFVRNLLPATDAFSAQLRAASLRRLGHGVFNALSHTMRAEYVQALLSALDQISTDDAFALKSTLASLPVDSAVLINVLTIISQPLEGSAASQKKRQKHDESNDDTFARAISQLTALLDSRDFSKMTPSPALLASLMSLLSLILARRQSIKEGLDYLEQEILSALVALLVRITDPQDITRAHIGIEVVIKVIRASGNPRTAQRALLVAGELARLVPEAVLHNIMPIFTFMGSSDLQRDDAYSFGVVEKTVERIVPVMTRSLRAKAKSKLELYQESKTFISIFTDMAARLPKHRTLPFFVHLVRSLGADDYLAPICMLLVDRSTTKAGRSGSSAAQTMELPQGVAAAFETDTKIETVLEVVREVARLVDDFSREDKQAFLANPDADQDRVLRQIAALLSLASTLARSIVGKPADQGIAEELVKTVLLLASAVSTSIISTSSIPAAVQGCLGTSMSLLSAHKFLGVVTSLLQGTNEQDITVALTVLIERLPRVRPDIRAANAAVISDIIKKTALLVKAGKRTVGIALRALQVIGTTAQKGEDAALASILPGLIVAVPTLSEAVEQVALLSLLEVAVRHLGSRIIPYIQSIVATTLALPPSSFSLTRQVFTLQAALIEVVANFMAPKQIVAICQNALKGHDGSKEVLSVISKKVPTKTVWPVVMELWKSVQTESSTVLSGFFDLLRLVLKNSDRNALPGLIKAIFAFFLDVFDLRHRLQLRQIDAEDISKVEDSAIGSFLELVTKLNEATFRPLFVRVYDWAVVDLSEGKAIDDGRLVERRTVLFRVMMGLLSKFKNLLSPYIGILLPHIEELLPAYAIGEITDEPLLNLLLDLLARSFDVDEGAFWTDAAYQKLVPSLVSLLDSSVTSSASLDLEDTPVEHLAACLAALAAATTTEQTLKSLNTAICLSTRSDVVSARLASLKALEAVWGRHAEELVPYVQETVGEFLSELVEDENGDVEVLARRVVKGIEANVGTVGEFLE